MDISIIYGTIVFLILSGLSIFFLGRKELGRAFKAFLFTTLVMPSIFMYFAFSTTRTVYQYVAFTI